MLFGALFKPLDIIYEDSNILILNKPSGIEVTGDNSLSSHVEKLYKLNGLNFIKPCHRLDRNTSGLVLFAKNQPALEELLDLFKTNKIEKHYHAITYGIPNKKYQYMTAYLFKDTKKSLVYISDEQKKGYLEIKTSYNVLGTNFEHNLALLDVQIYTRKNTSNKSSSSSYWLSYFR